MAETTAMKNVYTIETMRVWARRNGGVCLSSSYQGANKPLIWQCCLGHVWETIPNCIRRGSWCPQCKGRNPSVEDMATLASQRNGKPISKQIDSSASKIEWECSQGHRWFATPTDIKRGRWCPICGKTRRANSHRGTIEVMKIIAAKRGGICLSKEYINSETKLLWQCSRKHEWRATPASINRGTWCIICSGHAKKTIDDMKQYAESKGGICLSDEYKNRKTKLQWRCALGHKWQAPAYNVVYEGTWCPTCASKLNERICRAVFEQIFKRKFPSVWPAWLVNNRGNRMQLDGYCMELKIAFEFQGPHHYGLNTLMTPNKKVLKRRLMDDNLKEKLCLQRGVTLVKIKWKPKTFNWLPEVIEACEKANISLPINSEVLKVDLKGVLSPDQLSEAKLLALKRNGECLSTIFVAVNSPLLWQCSNGHIWEASLYSVRGGHWCRLCSNKQSGNWRRLSIEIAQEVARTKGGECLEGNYINDHTKMRWRCDQGHVWETTFHSIRTGSWCPICNSFPKGSIKEMRDIATARGGKCLSDLYTDAHTKVMWQCAKGHSWMATPSKVKGGTWCPECAKLNRGSRQTKK